MSEEAKQSIEDFEIDETTEEGDSEISKIKFYRKTLKYARTAKSVFDSVASMYQYKNPGNIMREGFSLAEQYLESKTNFYIDSERKYVQKRGIPSSMYPMLKSLIEATCEVQQIENDDYDREFKMFTLYGTSYMDKDNCFYADQEIKKDQLYRDFGRLILENIGPRVKFLPSDRGSIDSHSAKILPFDFKFVKQSKIGDDIYANVNKFLDKGYSRSIFLYGPPGSGKTTAANYLASRFNKVTLDIGDGRSAADNSQDIIFILKAIRPSVVIINDIDRDISASSYLLEFLEDIKNHTQVFIVTANRKDLPGAIMRPGRFDEVIEVKSLDLDSFKKLMVGFSDDVCKRIIEWPPAFLEELRRRVEVYGDDSIEDHIADLENRLKSNDKYQ